MDGHETVAPNPKTALRISKEILRVESRFHLILPWKNPRLFYQDEDVLPPPTAETSNNVRFYTLYKPLRGKAQSAFSRVECSTTLTGTWLLRYRHQEIIKSRSENRCDFESCRNPPTRMRQGFGEWPWKDMGFLILCIWNIFFKYRFFYFR